MIRLGAALLLGVTAAAVPVEASLTPDRSPVLAKAYRHPDLQIVNLERPTGAVTAPASRP
jgi:hypothetical protein